MIQRRSLADIAASIIGKNPLPASKELLDKIYEQESDEGKELERQLAAYGADRLSREIKATFSVLKQAIEDCSEAQNYLRSKVRPGTAYPIKAPFYTIFMAFFDLLVEQKKSPDQPQKIVDALGGLDEKLEKGAHYETTENRRKNIDLTIGLIQNFFVDKVPPALGHGPSLVIDFENALRRSRIETPRYEFKQGILRLDNKRAIDNGLLQRLVETACGIANLGPDSDGYIFLGVADRKAHAERIRDLDKIPLRQIADQFLVGIDREARLLKITLEEYVRRVVAVFQNTDITEPLKTHLLSSFDTIMVHGLTTIRIRIPAQRDVSFVSGQAYSREGSSTIEVQGPRLVAVTRLFH